MHRNTSKLIGPLLFLFSALVLLILVVGADLFIHQKFDRISALNYRGYRGKVVGDKKPQEVRIGLFGGSVAMGYGVPPQESIASQLQMALNDYQNSAHSVINLSATKEFSITHFSPSFEHFKYLNLDTVLFYFQIETLEERAKAQGYNARDPYPQRYQSFRTSNLLFRNFNYWYITHEVLREKYFRIRYKDISEGYKQDKLFGAMTAWMSDFVVAPPPSQAQRDSLKATLSELDRQNIQFVGILPPAREPGKWQATKTYLKKITQNLARHKIINLENIFEKKRWSDYFLDDLHLSQKGNHAIALAIARALRSSSFAGE